MGMNEGLLPRLQFKVWKIVGSRTLLLSVDLVLIGLHILQGVIT